MTPKQTVEAMRKKYKLLGLLHKLFKKHKWRFVKKDIGYYASGDVLPEECREYRCLCGAKRYKICRFFTHFGGKYGDVRSDKIID